MISIGIGDKNILSDADFNFNNLTEIPHDFINQLMKITETKVYK